MPSGPAAADARISQARFGRLGRVVHVAQVDQHLAAERGGDPVEVERGATVAAFDPVARHQAEKLFSGIEFADDAYAAADGADALVIVTEWDEFRALDLDKIAETMRGRVLVDLRNVYDRDEAEEAGLSYYGVGRGKVTAAE
jgi:UDPglucose 6-dehydrogenase